MVLLRHELLDGSWHFDWLIEPSSANAAPGGPDDRVLLAFRIAHRLDLGPPSEFRAERLANHRRLYLDYEGEIAGGRGRVTRVAAGTCRSSGWSAPDGPAGADQGPVAALATIDVYAQFLPGVEWHFRGTAQSQEPNSPYHFVFLGAS